MKIVLFSHPHFFSSNSMPRFTQMLKGAYESRGYQVQVWSPTARVINWVPRGRLSKWAGYIDQYVLFPLWVRKALAGESNDTMFVFCDQALGPWVPLVAKRPHAVHVHDLLALRSALGDIPENPTSFTGRVYQRYIRRGFQKARHFICTSKKTRDDLQRFGAVTPATLEVVYNGLNYPYQPMPHEVAVQVLKEAGLHLPDTGMLLHVGGGQWYKNLPGVIALYGKYAERAASPSILWCVGQPPNAAARAALAKLGPQCEVKFVGKLESRALDAAYSSARAFLFPSLAEGFGWPLIESQACNCPVLTTDEAPMNEVAGEAAYYLPRLAFRGDLDQWATHAGGVLAGALEEDATARARRVEKGREWANRFDANRAIDGYLAIYQAVFGAAVTHGGEAPVLKARVPS